MGNDLYSAIDDIFVGWNLFIMSNQYLHIALNGISCHIQGLINGLSKGNASRR